MYAASSRDALKGARSTLESELRGAPNGAATAFATGDELLAVSRVVRGDRGLEAGLGDVAAPAASRSAVATAVFGSKVSPATVAVVEAVAGAHWSRSADVAAGLRDLGVDALLDSARQADTLISVQDELFRLGRIVAADPELERSLADRTRTPADRSALLASLIEGKVDPVTAVLATNAIAEGESAPADALLALSERAAASGGKTVAYVSSATELSDAQRSTLSESLVTIAGGPVTIQADIDPSLLGGLVVRIGDERIDGSIAGRFAAARRRLQ